MGAASDAARGTGLTAVPPTSRAPAAPLRVALVGNPNTGKSTLFNALTGLRQRVGNFAGVTVERVEGSYTDADGLRVSVLDLPGAYSLDPHTPDEASALDVLAGRADVPVPDVVVIVADALHLERNLYLVSQLLELGLVDSFRLFEQPEKSFSWWDYRMLGYQKNRGLRIDHVLVSEPVKAMVKACSIDRAPRKWEKPSDHAPVTVELG